jgi:lipoprotein-anchoring transpeptidase ErfK/SrfK
VYLIMKNNTAAEEAPQETVSPAAPAASQMALPATPLAPAADTSAATPESRAAIADAKAAVAGGQLLEAKSILDRLVTTTPSPEAIQLLGEVNIKLLKSPVMIPGKEYYVIQSGDYLFKIAKDSQTTVELIKEMNGLETDNIRAGSRLLVFNGNFTIRVSKQQNHLDLLMNGKLFKRYAVGTGKFGKTPAVEFSIVDKIVEPPWTRPSDNRQIEYGDPENVLGTRWMALTAKDHPELTGFGIHGTWERDSIGKQSSAGCIRMLNEDVEELFDLVPRKTTVMITD